MIARKRHFPEMAQNPNVTIVGCCDYLLERAQEMTQIYGGNAYDDYKTLIDTEKPDAVVVCSNNKTHSEVTVYALEAGAHVLCEKPMADGLEEAAKMIKAADAGNRKLMIAQNQRMAAAHKKAKELLVSGKLGRVLTFRTVFGHPGCEFWAIDAEKSWFFQKDLAVFGCLADLGVHKLDLLRWLLNEEFVEVSAICGVRDKKLPSGAPIPVEDNMVALLKTQSGTFGTIATSWTYYGNEDNSTVLYCENGILYLCADPEYAVKIEYKDGTKELYQLGGVGTNDQPIKTGIDDEFIDSILENRTPAISGREGYNSLAVAVAIAEASRDGGIAKVRHYGE